MTEIAKLYASIGADTSDFSRAMAGVDKDLSGFQKGMAGLQSAVGTGLKVAAGVAVGAIGGLGAGIVTATKAAADMEQGIANIAAVMGKTSDEVAPLKELIMNLGLDPNLKVTATEAAQAIEMLAKNGLTMTEIVDGAARSTVLLANSTGADFATAADIATDVMQQFNISAGDMDKAIDGIAGVTIASKFSIDDYRLAIAQAGGVASAVGVDFDDFNAVIAATSPSFASGSDAGTSFKTFLQRLVPQTKDSAEMMRDLGLLTGLTSDEYRKAEAALAKVESKMNDLDPTSKNYAKDLAELVEKQQSLVTSLEHGQSAFFTSEGSMKSMSEIAEILQGAFGGLSEAQAIEAAATLFGTDAMRTAFALAKGGGETIDEMKRIIGDTSAEDAAATRMNTLSGKWEIFTGVVDTLKIGIGEKFLPVAEGLIEWTTRLAQEYGPLLLDWFGKLSAGLDYALSLVISFIQDGGQFTALIDDMPGPIGEVVRGIRDFIDNISEAIRWIGDILGQFVTWQDVWTAAALLVGVTVVTAIGSFLAAIAPVVGVIAGVVAAVALLRNAWENDWLGIKTATNTAKEYLADRFGGLGSTIREFGGDALGEIKAWAMGQDTEFTATKKIWESAKSTFSTVFADMGKKLKEWGDTAWNEFQTRFPKSAEALTKAWDSVKQKWNEFWGVLKPAIDKLVATVRGMVDSWTDGTGDMSGAIETAKGVIDGIFRILVTIVETNIKVILDTMKLVVQLLSGDWKGAWETAKEIFGTIWDGMSSIATTALDTILEAFGLSMDDVSEYVGEMATTGKQFWANFKSGAETTWGTVNTKLREWWGIIEKFAADNGPWMLERGREYWSMFRQGAVERYGIFHQWLTARWNELPQPVRDAISDMFGYGYALISGLWDGMKSIWTTVYNWTTARWNDLKSGFKTLFGIHSPSTVFAEYGRNIMEGLQGGLDSGKAEVFSSFDSLSSGILTRANALEVTLDGSIAQIAGRITALQNHQAALANLDRVAAEQVAAYKPPTVSTGVTSTKPNNVGSHLGTIAGQGFGTVDAILGYMAQFAKDAADYGGSLGYDVAAAAGLVGPAYRDAYFTLTDDKADTDQALITAIYTLIGALKNAPNNPQFQLNMTSAQTGDTYNDLANAIAYLNILYAG